MKKTVIFIIAIAAIAIASCSKSDSTTTTPTPTPTPTVGKFSVNNSLFTQISSFDSATTDFFGASGNLFVVLGNTSDNSKVGEFYVIFAGNHTKPTAGTYTIGTGGIAGTVGIVYIDSLVGNGKGLYSTDSLTGGSVTVAINNGKITATVPTIKMNGLFTPFGTSSNTYNDTVTVNSATLIEQ